MIPKLDHYKTKWNVEGANAIKPGLDAMNKALEKLQHPEANLPIVHLAGTNGKGSTITFLEQIARAHGLSVGKFMSPCIVDVHDQIQFNGQPVSEEEMDELFQQIKKVSGLLTDFELLTCVAFLYFQKVKPDLVLLEAGMGGLEDSTNVITPIASIIPSIALEHTAFLGNSLSSIATHKAGIIKEKRPIIVGNLPEEAMTVISSVAQQKKAPLLVLGDQFFIECTEESEVYINKQKGLLIHDLHRSLPGNHQGGNMALAITAFVEVAQTLQIKVSVDEIREAVMNAQIPGRFEEVLPNVYFDGAHNPASAETLIQTIRAQFPKERIRFVVGMLKDKDVSAVLSLYEQISDEFYFVDFHNARAMKASEILALSNANQKKVIRDVATFLKENPFDGITFFTGSLYLLAELRQRLLN